MPKGHACNVQNVLLKKMYTSVLGAKRFRVLVREFQPGAEACWRGSVYNRVAGIFTVTGCS